VKAANLGSPLRVLGVDPGLTRCGVGVVEASGPRRVSAVHFDVVRTPADAELADRLSHLYDELTTLVARHRPDVVAVERVFSQHNVRTVMGTAQAAGIAVLVAKQAGIDVAMHTPTEVKASITGSGSADKDQVGTMVTRLLGLSERPKPADCADALALAICHLWRGTAQRRLAQALAAGRPA